MRRANLVAPCVVAGLLMLAPSLCFGGVIIAGSSYAAYDAAMAGIDAVQAVGSVSYAGAPGPASGNYLGDGWVLTAAHVATQASVFTFTINGNTYASSEVDVYPGWTGQSESGGDIALIKLTESNIPAQTVPLYSGTTAGLLDQVVTLSGFGMTGTGVTGPTGNSGEHHSGQNRIEATGGAPYFPDDNPTTLFFDFDDPLVTDDGYEWSQDAALDYEYSLAPGDSGSGAFVLVNGHYVLAGLGVFVIPFDENQLGKYGDIDGLTSVTDYQDWIAQVSGHDFTVPEPATLVLLALGTLVMARHRHTA